LAETHHLLLHNHHPKGAKMKSLSIALLVVACALVACQQQQQQPQPKPLTDAELREKANRLAHEFIIVDTHVDTPDRLRGKMADISQRTEDGDFDYVRAKAGGLDAPFMSIYVPAEYEGKGGAKKLANKLIDMAEKFATNWPDKFAIAQSVADVQAQFAKGLISLPMGMENGSPIEGKLENLRHFYDRGIRYITLAHSKSNHISDSSYDPNRRWNGLSPFGKEVVAEMNRLGIMIDISHVSDSTFYQVIRLSQAPAIASHSSCRHFTPGWERNMDDEMIKALAKNGGVILINFG
jgi:membrane dipeptidase